MLLQKIHHKAKRICKLLVIGLISVTLLCGNGGVTPDSTYTFTGDEVIKLYQHIDKLEYNSELDSLTIDQLNKQIEWYKTITVNDSIIIQKQFAQLQLKNELVEELKPKWYETKTMYFIYGAGTIVLSSWVISNVK